MVLGFDDHYLIQNELGLNKILTQTKMPLVTGAAEAAFLNSFALSERLQKLKDFIKCTLTTVYHFSYLRCKG